VATPPCWSNSSCSLRASAGVFQPSVLRGLAFSAPAMASISSRLHRERSVPLGKYWRSRPLDAPMFVIPEGAGTVKSFDQGCGAARILLIWLSLLGGRREAARRRGHGGAPAAQRGRTTLRPSRAGRRMGGEGDGLLGRTSFGWVSRGDAAPSPATAGPGQPRARVPVIPSPRRAAWSCAAAAGRAQSSGRPRRQAGVMTNASARPGTPTSGRARSGAVTRPALSGSRRRGGGP
jgi:hypothetical protein